MLEHSLLRSCGGRGGSFGEYLFFLSFFSGVEDLSIFWVPKLAVCGMAQEARGTGDRLASVGGEVWFVGTPWVVLSDQSCSQLNFV